MEKKQTAVEWLVNEINKMNVSTEARLFINKLKRKAIEMEKGQIENAYYRGAVDREMGGGNFEEYCYETFNKK